MSSDGDTAELEVPTVRDDDGTTSASRRDRILDLREKVAAVRNDVRLSVIDGTLSRQRAGQAYRATLETYLIELEDVFKKFGGEDVWHGLELGVVTIPPPRDDLEVERVELVGLRALIEHPTPLVGTWEVPEQGVRDPAGTRTVSVEGAVPFGILDTAYRETNLFLADVGFDVEADTGADEWEV